MLIGFVNGGYRVFNGAGKDFGSGISNNDNTHYLSLTSTYVPAYTFSGRSFAISPSDRALTLYVNGTGTGTISSNPSGIACNVDCNSLFPFSTNVTLSPFPADYNLFAGWSNGPCTGIGDCLLTMNNDASVTATFDKDTAHQVSIGGSTSTYYSTIQDAYNAITSDDIIRLWGITYSENLTCNRPATVTLQGGYNSDYTAITGESILNGVLSILDGTVIVDGLSIQ